MLFSFFAGEVAGRWQRHWQLGQRIQLQREQWEREVERQHKEDLEHMKQKNKERMTGMFFSKMHQSSMAKAFGGGELGEEVADLLHRIKFDLPLEGLIDDTKLSGTTPPAPVKPDKAELSSIKPNKANSKDDHTASETHETPP
jgi:hypothetical protein